MKFPTSAGVFDITFQRDPYNREDPRAPRATVCMLRFPENGVISSMVLTTALCSRRDQFVKETGRVVALERALRVVAEMAGPATAEELLRAYHNRPRTPGIPKQQRIDALVQRARIALEGVDLVRFLLPLPDEVAAQSRFLSVDITKDRQLPGSPPPYAPSILEEEGPLGAWFRKLLGLR